jgi:hypothetical protein
MNRGNFIATLSNFSAVVGNFSATIGNFSAAVGNFATALGNFNTFVSNFSTPTVTSINTRQLQCSCRKLHFIGRPVIGNFSVA